MSGIVALQAFLYYRNYPNDHILLKYLVAFTWYAEHSHIVILFVLLNAYDQLPRPRPSRRHHVFRVLSHNITLGCVPARMNTVSRASHLSALFYPGDFAAINNLTWSWGTIILLHTLIMVICQGFLTYRFKIISNNNWWITTVLALVALLQFVAGIISTARALGRGITLVSAGSSCIPHPPCMPGTH
jgi:hypothetical protein